MSREWARTATQVLYGSLDGRGKIGRPVGRWKNMIEGDIRRHVMVGTTWPKIESCGGMWCMVNELTQG